MSELSAEPLVAAIKKVMREHGSDLLYPDEDEFDCCAEQVASLFERVAWYQPRRHPGEQFWSGSLEPNEQWTQPVVPVYGLKAAPTGGIHNDQRGAE